MRIATPDSRLGQTKLLLLLVGVMLTLIPLGQVNVDNSDVLPLSIAAELAIVTLLVVTARRGRHLSIWEAPASAVLTLLAALSIEDPLAGTSFCVGIILSQTLYDGRFNAVLRLVSFLPVLPLAASLSPSPFAADLHWYDSPVLAPVAVIPLFLVLIRSLQGALEAQEKSLGRERFLGSLTSRLLAAHTPRSIAAVLGPVTQEMCRAAPGLVGYGLRLEAADATGRRMTRVVHTVGPVDGHRPETIPAEVFAGLERVWNDELVEVPDGTETLARNGLPKQYVWRIRSLGLPPGTAAVMGFEVMLWGFPQAARSRYLRLSDPVAAEMVNLVSTVQHHARIANQTANERERLLDRAERDGATGLLNRWGFSRRLETALATGDGRITLVFVRLTGMVGVATAQGLAGVDAALAQLGGRLLDVVEDQTITSRFSDFVLAVALAGEVPEAELQPLLRQLRERLAEPVTFPSGLTESLVVHLGTSRTETGDGAGGYDLIQRATDSIRTEMAAATETHLQST